MSLVATKAGIDEFVVTEFTCGLCCELAIELRSRTGWPIYVELDERGEILHAWVVNPRGRAVDIQGIHPTSRARTPHNHDWVGPISEWSVDQLEAHGLDAEGEFWAKEIVEQFPEHFGIEP